MSFDFDKYADEMQAAVEPLRAERHQKAAELDELDEQLRRLDTAIRALNGLLPRNGKPKKRIGSSGQTRAAILKVLQENGPEVSRRDIALHAGVSTNTVDNTMAVLVEEGKARIANPDRKPTDIKLFQLVVE